MDKNILDRYKALVSDLNRYSYEYYNNNNSVVTDSEYDELYLELLSIEQTFPHLKADDSPSNKIGFKSNSKLKKVVHKTPMLSLENAFSMSDIQKFYERIAKALDLNVFDIEIFAEPKIDGLSASLVYENGKLVLGSTRGNGLEGEDVTNNIKTIKSVPKTINVKENIEIRGEVYLPLSKFKLLNENQIKNNLETFSNPRNAASGSLRMLDSSVVSERNLQFFAYQVIGMPRLETQASVYDFLSHHGFLVNPITSLCKSLHEIETYYLNLMNERNLLDYEIDGVVYKINNFKQQQTLGITSKYPKYSIAHKFPAQCVTTRIISIETSVGRSGIITPIAILDPIQVGGVLVSKATLHNKNEIIRKDIRVNDYVILKRAGDVIPQIVGVVLEKRSSESIPFTFPSNCPVCNSIVIEEGAFIKCSAGKNCPAQNLENLTYFVSKDAFNITGLARNTLLFLIKNNFIKSHKDIFLLEEINEKASKKIKEFNGWDDVSVNKLFSEINERRNISLDKFIYSLGIPQVGKNIAKLLVAKLFTIDNFLKIKSTNTDMVRLLNIEGIGPSISKSIIDYFSQEENINNIKDLISVVNILQNQENLKNYQNFLFEQRIVFTGRFNTISRQEAVDLAVQAGAFVTDAVSKKTDIVIVGDSPGSKFDKAKSLGIKILEENDFLNLIKSQ